MKYIALTFVAVCLLFVHLSAQFVSKMVEYLPAPGQLINTEMAGNYKAAGSVVGSLNGLVSLGAFGGYIVLGFDQPIVNDTENPYGVDFIIFGNPQPDWSEPGIVMVMKDENRNGKADDIWYELAGSDYFFATTDHNFSVTYQNPLFSGSRDVNWQSSDLMSGIIQSNNFHKQDFYPSEIFFNGNFSQSVTFSGTRIADWNDISNPATVRSYQRRFGYADNICRNNLVTGLPDNPYTLEVEGCGGDAMDISWAVNGYGDYINLDQIDFVKVYCGVLANAGWLGEISTEICGIADVAPNASVSGANDCVVFNSISKKILSGDSLQLEATIFQKGRLATDRRINWSVDDDQIASVNSNGLLNLNGKGNLKVTASIKDKPTVFSSQYIEVVRPASIEIIMASVSIRVDEETGLKALVKDDAQNVISGVEIEWKVKDGEVVSLYGKDSQYFIRGLHEGKSFLEAYLKGKPEIKASVLLTVLSESSQKEVFITVKDDISTLIPRDMIWVNNFNLNPYINQPKGDYGIGNIPGVTVAHAIARVFENVGLNNDFRFRDDGKGGGSLYIWKLPKGDPSNVDFIYGYGGSTASTALSKCWVILLNNEQYINGFDKLPLKNGDELIVYFVPNINYDWKVTCFNANKNEVNINDALEVYSTELTCNMGTDGRILVKGSFPLQDQPIWVDNEVAYFNGGKVATDETGMATLRFNQPGIKNISAGIDKMVVKVNQPASSFKISERGGVVKIWPQPANGTLNISVENQIISSTKIFDLSGRCMMEKNGVGSGLFSMNTDDIDPGIFILQVFTNNGNSNHKIIIR